MDNPSFRRIRNAILGLSFLLPAATVCAQTGDEEGSASGSVILDSSELMFHFLAAEISAYQGDLAGAYEHYRKITPEARDAAIAKRSARIAIHLKSPEALAATALWAELAPDDLEAWKTLIALHLQEKNESQAMAAAESLISAAKRLDKDGYIEVAAVAAGAQDIESAKALIEAVSEKYRRDPKAQYALAVALFGLKQFDAVEEALRKTIAIKKDDVRVWLLLSRVLDTLDRPDAAKDALVQGLTHVPDSRLLRLAHAERLVAAELYEEAYDVYHEVLLIDADNEAVIQALGGIAFELERWQEAREYWKRVLKMHGKQNRARYFLGEIERRNGNTEKAIEYFSRVNGLLRGDARIQMAFMQMEEGDIEQARETLSHQRLLSPSHAVTFYGAEAEMLDEAGLPQESMEVYDTAIKEYPDSIELLYSRGMQAIKLDRLDLMERDMRTILELDPDNGEAMNALGYTLADETDRFAEAFELITRALELMPDSAAVLDSMGWVLYRLGKLDEALDYLRQAMAKNDDGEIAAHLGEVLWMTGEHEEAETVWKEALIRHPDSVHVNETMSRLKKTDE